MLEEMNWGGGTAKRILSAGLLGLVLLPLPWSCQRRPRAPVAQPPPNYFEVGERAFDAGDYAQAIEAYNAYVHATPLGPNADRVLFRLALAYALPESPARDATRSTELLQQLMRDYPHSVFRSPAEFLLRQQSELAAQQSEVQKLRADLGQREAQIQEMNQQLDRVRQVELQRLRADLTRREERIKQLTDDLEKLKGELDQLKQIDLQRRPSTPPR